MVVCILDLSDLFTVGCMLLYVWILRLMNTPANFYCRYKFNEQIGMTGAETRGAMNAD